MPLKLFESTQPVFVQGMTGKEGSRMTRWMRESGTRVVAGITPGKGGQTVEDCPIFNSVTEACAVFPGVYVSSIAVPAPYVLPAFREAIDAGIKFIHILSEQIPVHDVLAMRELARMNDAIILGPSSVGFLQFPRFRLGYIGGPSPFEALREGSTAVVSSSGGMVNEIMMSLARQGCGIRVCLSIGGDRLPATSLEEAVRACEAWPDVKSLAVFAEPGNPLLLSLMRGHYVPQKPMVIFLPGDALEDLPKGLPYGHTGTILSEGDESLTEIRRKIRERGIACVASMSDFLAECQQYV